MIEGKLENESDSGRKCYGLKLFKMRMRKNGGEEIRMYRYTMEAVEKKANSSAEKDKKAGKLWTYFMRSPMILTFFHESFEPHQSLSIDDKLITSLHLT